MPSRTLSSSSSFFFIYNCFECMPRCPAHSRNMTFRGHNAALLQSFTNSLNVPSSPSIGLTHSTRSVSDRWQRIERWVRACMMRLHHHFNSIRFCFMWKTPTHNSIQRQINTFNLIFFHFLPNHNQICM